VGEGYALNVKNLVGLNGLSEDDELRAAFDDTGRKHQERVVAIELRVFSDLSILV